MSTRDHNPISRHLRSPSRKNADDAMCARCVGCTRDHLEPRFKEDIKNCSDNDCPMHKRRPYQKAEKTPLDSSKTEQLSDPIRLDISSEKLANQLIVSPENVLTEATLKVCEQSEDRVHMHKRGN